MVSKTKQFKNNRNSGDRQKPVQEFEQKLLDVSRVARVTAGGRRFNFRTVVVVGDKSGRVGVGSAKGRDVRISMEKAVRKGKKNMFRAPITEEGTIPHESYGKSASALVFLKPAPAGRGIIAGGAVRVVCDLAGYKDIIGKMISRTNNKLNNARATIEALKNIKPISDLGLASGSSKVGLSKASKVKQKSKTYKKIKKDADTSAKTKIRKPAEKNS